jgi:2,4-dienoyl-CoA reductase-like NADH-dependent reductase (Old Yellow Enzyme family)
MAQPIKPPIFDAIDLEREIAEEFRKLPPPEREPQPTDFAPPSVRAPDLAMPDYVEHRDGVPEIGKLSAEAVVREYEAAAKDIEALGVDLVEHVKKCEAMTRDALLVIEELKETAAQYRDEAKRVFLQIENCSLLTAEVRKTCAEMKERIATPATVELTPQEINAEPRKKTALRKVTAETETQP